MVHKPSLGQREGARIFTAAALRTLHVVGMVHILAIIGTSMEGDASILTRRSSRTSHGQKTFPKGKKQKPVKRPRMEEPVKNRTVNFYHFIIPCLPLLFPSPQFPFGYCLSTTTWNPLASRKQQCWALTCKLRFTFFSDDEFTAFCSHLYYLLQKQLTKVKGENNPSAKWGGRV